MLQIPEIECGDVVLQPIRKCAYVCGNFTKLTKQEAYLLEALALCAGTLVTRRMLDAVRHKDTGFQSSDDHHVDPHISRLRRKLCGSERVHIRSVAKQGYKLVVT